MKKPVTDIKLAEMKEVMSAIGLKPYAAKQILSWLYEKRVSSFEEMSNVSKEARAKLGEKFSIDALSVEEVRESTDFTKKYACKTSDGLCVECVKIPTEEGRCTACLSTQAGCAMNCAFCRTAKNGLSRSLTQGEILSQLIIMMRDGADFTNIVFMGMGEPLANFDGVSDAIDVLASPDAFNISKRRITVSTVGLIDELEKFIKHHQVKIAISLNATTDEVRTRLMPINKKYPIARIMDFSRRYTDQSRFRITFEYVMMKGVNDSTGDAYRLASLLAGISAKVNLIPFNEFEGSEFRSPDEKTVDFWREFLFSKGIQANIRISRGKDIYAACGMLALKDK